jgi:hypothetical protein
MFGPRRDLASDSLSLSPPPPLSPSPSLPPTPKVLTGKTVAKNHHGIAAAHKERVFYGGAKNGL